MLICIAAKHICVYYDYMGMYAVGNILSILVLFPTHMACDHGG